MPFDPAWPQNGQNIDADRFRGQFAGIIDLIGSGSGINAAQVDSTNTLPPSTPANASVSVVGNTLHFTFEIPQGQEGPMGQQGPPFSQAVVDAVNTVNPGDPAAVGVSFDGTNVRFTFDIPRGNDGMNGSDGSDGSQGPPGNNGSDGSQGPPGNDGAQGPPFAQAVVDGVTTLDPGQQATVGVSFDGSNVRFTFAIPRGNDGSNGSDGSQGPPGEISQAQLDSAISGTSANTNGVSTLDTAFADPDMEAMRQKLNEMILNGRR
ncbi:MAG: hypothetical protein U1F81_21400 [Verrucomicrobiaceae bacterium]